MVLSNKIKVLLHTKFVKKPTKKQLDKLAKVLTRVFSPETSVFVLSGMLYHRYVPKSEMNFVIWFGVTALFIVIAVIFAFVLYKQNKISDLNITKREERPQFFFPILALMTVLTILDYLVGWSNAASCLGFITFSYAVAFTITLFFKISIHVFSQTLVYLLALMIYSNIWVALLFPIPIITAWTRVRLKKHTYNEVLIGFVVPFILVMIWLFVKIDVTKLAQ